MDGNRDLQRAVRGEIGLHENDWGVPPGVSPVGEAESVNLSVGSGIASIRQTSSRPGAPAERNLLSLITGYPGNKGVTATVRPVLIGWPPPVHWGVRAVRGFCRGVESMLQELTPPSSSDDFA